MLDLKFQNQVSEDYKIEEKDFSSWFKKSFKVLREFDKENGFIELNVVSEKTITKLNKAYRGKNKSTDVLSFSFIGQEKFPGEDVVGQIVICAKIANKQAQEHGWSFKKEMHFLFIHGMIHVAGYDHETPEDFKKMFKIHAQIMPDQEWAKFVKKIFKESFEN
jgi:rRNA maturation RNase YbeY